MRREREREKKKQVNETTYKKNMHIIILTNQNTHFEYRDFFFLFNHLLIKLEPTNF